MPFIYLEDQATKVWKPNKRQADFISIPDSIREGLFGGAAGGGKSEVLLALPILKGWISRPGFRGCIFRRSVPQLEESLIPRAKVLYKAIGATYNENKREFTFPQSGLESPATIKLDYLGCKEDALAKDTVEYNYVGWDELTHFEEFEYNYITFSRLRGDVRVSRSGTNPGNIGHVWVRDRFVIHDPNGYLIITNKKTGLKRVFIPSLVTDNEWLMANDPDYINALHELPEAEKRAKLYGDWFVFAGMVFTEYRDTHIGDEPDNALHVINPFDIPIWWPRIASIDWGFQAYTHILWSAISPDHRCFAYREYHQRQRDISDWAKTFRDLSAGERLVAVAIDPSAAQRRGSKNIVDQFYDHSGYHAILADNDRLGGKMLVHEYLRWKPKDRYIPPEGYSEKKFWEIYRLVGEKAAVGYKALFEEQEAEKNIPKLQIFKHLTALRGAISLARYNEKGDPEDVAEWAPTFDNEKLKSPGDDPYDNLRYHLKQVERFINEGGYLTDNMKKVNDALQTLSVTGDQTSFHIKMDRLEHEQYSKGFGIPTKPRRKTIWNHR